MEDNDNLEDYEYDEEESSEGVYGAGAAYSSSRGVLDQEESYEEFEEDEESEDDEYSSEDFEDDDFYDDEDF